METGPEIIAKPPTRRRVLSWLALAPSLLTQGLFSAESRCVKKPSLVLSNFDVEPAQLAPGIGWRGFSDRVMGGASDASLTRATIAGRGCIRLTGRVTREGGGGFIQMAMDLGGAGGSFDAAEYAGLEIIVRGNDEDYNLHVRTPDCSWYGHSYRLTFRARPEWQTLRFAWAEFKPNGISVPLDVSRLQRIAILGWMRDFDADVSLAQLALYAC